MDSEGSLQGSQEPANGPYPWPLKKSARTTFWKFKCHAISQVAAITALWKASNSAYSIHIVQTKTISDVNFFFPKC